VWWHGYAALGVGNELFVEADHAAVQIDEARDHVERCGFAAA